MYNQIQLEKPKKTLKNLRCKLNPQSKILCRHQASVGLGGFEMWSLTVLMLVGGSGFFEIAK